MDLLDVQLVNVALRKMANEMMPLCTARMRQGCVRLLEKVRSNSKIHLEDFSVLHD